MIAVNIVVPDRVRRWLETQAKLAAMGFDIDEDDVIAEAKENLIVEIFGPDADK